MLRRFFGRQSVVRLLATIDWIFLVVPILLSLFGMVVLFSFQSRQFLAFNQIIFIGFGMVVMFATAFFDYRSLRGTSWYVYGLVLLLLVLVGFFGSTIFGARRWIDLGFFQLQPSEIAKLSSVLILGHLLAHTSDGPGHSSVKILLTILTVMATPIVFIVKQPDLGTASVLVALTIGLLAHQRFPKRWWAVAGVLVLGLIPLLYQQLLPYQRQRIYTFLNPQHDPSGGGYNIIQSVIAIGSGGIWGRGLGEGSQSQLQFLPVAHSDFIFAGVAEAFGFLGSSTLVSLYLILVWRGAKTSAIAQDQFGQIVALGATILWLYQGFVNIGMNIGLTPVTGIPLPFVSSGGTAMIMNYFLAGILQSIYIRHKKIRF